MSESEEHLVLGEMALLDAEAARLDGQANELRALREDYKVLSREAQRAVIQLVLRAKR